MKKNRKKTGVAAMNGSETGKKRSVGRILADLFLLLVVAFTANLSQIRLHRIHTVVLADDYRKVFTYELVLCAALLVFALDLRFGIFSWRRFRLTRAVGRFLRAAAALLGAAVLFFLGLTVYGGLTADDVTPAGQAIVLGMALEEGRPTRDLQLRLDTAADFAHQNPGATLILTGGNADESGRTEAEVMRELLIARGVPEDRLLLEDRAETTKENFRNAAALIDPTAPTALITSSYHMGRAVRTAESAGFTAILRCPAPAEPRSYLASLSSEVVLTLNDLTKG